MGRGKEKKGNLMATFELVIGDRVALVAGNKVYRGVVDNDPNRAPGSEWFLKLEIVEKGEPTEVQFHKIAQPEIGTCATGGHSGDNHPRQADCINFIKAE
jgi:hypothetical protein